MPKIDYPKHLSLAHLPTPIRLLKRFSKKLNGPRIWVKNDALTGVSSTGNKVRKLEFLLADAKQQKAEVILTAGSQQSNHCRATALLSASLDFKTHLLLRGRPAPLKNDGNLFLDYLSGAHIAWLPINASSDDINTELLHLQKSYQNEGKKAYIIPIGGSNAIGTWGYIKAFKELVDDFIAQKIKPKSIFCATGSGGTQAGLLAGVSLYNYNVDICGIAVCDNTNYFQNKIRADLIAWQQMYPQMPIDISSLNIDIDDRFIGKGYGHAGKEIFKCIQQLAQTEGLVLDPVYTGKAFYGLIKQIEEGRFKTDDDIVFIHTGGIFGLFAQKEECMRHIDLSNCH